MIHRVFVSYHHARDQAYANELRAFYGASEALIDRSLPEKIRSDDDEYILGQIRTKHLQDSTVTIVLIGKETWARKWVDWEIYSSLRPYGERTINGLLGVILPGAENSPARFYDNYSEAMLFGKSCQTGYAKAISWDAIAPPQAWRRLGVWHPSVKAKRDCLMYWVDAAFQNRNRPDLISNDRPRMQKNANDWSWW